MTDMTTMTPTVTMPNPNRDLWEKGDFTRIAEIAPAFC